MDRAVTLYVVHDVTRDRIVHHELRNLSGTASPLKSLWNTLRHAWLRCRYYNDRYEIEITEYNSVLTMQTDNTWLPNRAVALYIVRDVKTPRVVHHEVHDTSSLSVALTPCWNSVRRFWLRMRYDGPRYSIETMTYNSISALFSQNPWLKDGRSS